MKKIVTKLANGRSRIELAMESSDEQEQFRGAIPAELPSTDIQFCGWEFTDPKWRLGKIVMETMPKLVPMPGSVVTIPDAEFEAAQRQFDADELTERQRIESLNPADLATEAAEKSIQLNPKWTKPQKVAKVLDWWKAKRKDAPAATV